MSVVPFGARRLLIPADGITINDEQSNVFCVVSLKVVGIFAFALLTLGKYPPLAEILIICVPFWIVTFSSGFVFFISFELDWILRSIKIIAATENNRNNPTKIVLLLSFSLFIF